MPPPNWYFSLQQRWMEHKGGEGTGKSMKNVLYVLRYAKKYPTLNSVKIKHVALAIVKLHWSEGIRQAVK